MENKIQKSFNQIHADSLLKESTKQYLSTKRKKRTYVLYAPAIRRTLLSACILLLLAIGIGSYSWIQRPVSYVSIDVNPSMELALNRWDHVVAITAYNTEGQEILDGLSLKGKSYTEAINSILNCNKMNQYLTDESELVFTVAADQNKTQKLTTGVKNCSCHITRNSQSISTDLEIVSKAHDNGLSVGKYYAYLQLLEYDNQISINDCKHMSMSEIHGLINEHKGKEAHEQNQNHEQQKNQNHSQNRNGHNGHSPEKQKNHH